MNAKKYNAYCASLAHSTHVNQWGGADVWKIGGKVFAIGWFAKGYLPAITFKVSEMAYEMLRDAPGLRPAPYLASRGLKWIQNYDEPGLSDKDLKEFLAESYRIVSLGLTRKLQKQLGLNQDA